MYELHLSSNCRRTDYVRSTSNGMYNTKNSQLISVWTATFSCSAQTGKGGINLFIKLEKLKLNQID